MGRDTLALPSLLALRRLTFDRGLLTAHLDRLDAGVLRLGQGEDQDAVTILGARPVGIHLAGQRDLFAELSRAQANPDGFPSLRSSHTGRALQRQDILLCGDVQRLYLDG